MVLTANSLYAKQKLTGPVIQQGGLLSSLTDQCPISGERAEERDRGPSKQYDAGSMGASESKLAFKEDVFRLAGEPDIAADSHWWARVGLSNQVAGCQAQTLSLRPVCVLVHPC